MSIIRPIIIIRVIIGRSELTIYIVPKRGGLIVYDRRIKHTLNRVPRYFLVSVTPPALAVHYSWAVAPGVHLAAYYKHGHFIICH